MVAPAGGAAAARLVVLGAGGGAAADDEATGVVGAGSQLDGGAGGGDRDRLFDRHGIARRAGGSRQAVGGSADQTEARAGDRTCSAHGSGRFTTCRDQQSGGNERRRAGGS